MTKDNEPTVLRPSAAQENKSTTENNDFNFDATQLSSTELEQFQTALTDDEATRLLAPSDNQATVIAGGTQAIQMAISPVSHAHIGIGSVIKERFTLEKLLGRGGMGEVYLASDKRKLEAQDNNPYVALKVLGENFKRHPQAFIALQREARKTQELAHPNIVTVYDFDREGDTVYLTMEALDGKPMDEEIRSEARETQEACQMIRQCAQGLAYAHHKNLVHSDLKPGNLFLTNEGNVKLLDFGIARAFKSGKSLDKQNSKQDTVFDAGDLGALTPAYATCEMIEGQAPHPSDDVYALGLIAYELLTGKHPFDKKMATEAEAENLKVQRIKALSKTQWLAIEHALAFRRENRLQDAEQFLKQFTAKSKTPLYVASTLIVIAFIAVASINVFIEHKQTPTIAFEQLEPALQSKITALQEETALALKFEDYNSALSLLNDAFLLHPYNPKTMQLTDALLDKLIPLLTQQAPATRSKQIDNLFKYTFLKDNRRLHKLAP